MRRQSRLLLGVVVVSLLLGRSVSADEKPGWPPKLYPFCMEMPAVANPSIPAQVKLLRELGFDGVGYSLWLGEEMDKNLRSLDEAGLKLYLVYMTVNLDPGKPAFDARVPEAFAKLKGRHVTVSVLLQGLPPGDSRGLERAVKVLRELSDLAAKSDLRISIYHHLNDWTESFLYALEVVKSVDRRNVGVNFNLCHWLKVDGDKDYRPVLRENVDRIFAVTINGAQKDAEAWTNGLIQPLDRGDFDNRELLAVLQEIGYRGPVGLMCYGIPDDTREHLSRSMRVWESWSSAQTPAAECKYNVLFIISDDLTATALSCYGNTVCQTPNIDAIAASGTRFTRAYCQGTYCGPSRASLMSGYYPHATGVLGYKSPRPQIGDRATWSQHFKNHGYYTARVSKIYHMGVPGGIENGGNGADDPASWTERFNSLGPEWKAPGNGETLENNPDGKKPAVGGNTFVVVEADGDDLVHADGKTAAKAVELIEKHKNQPFWLGVGFVRPHVPFVAPRYYYPPFLPYDKMLLPEKVEGDWDDIPKAGINYKTSVNMKMDIRRQKKAVGGYYASVAFMDAQVGKVMAALRKAGLEEKTIVIFTSDHGYHLGEHDFWAKVSLRDESAGVPLIIRVPGKEPAVCHSLTELLDLYPTISRLCGLEVPKRLQGKDISPVFDDPTLKVRDAAFSVAPMRKGFLLREDKWAFIQYKEDASAGIELFDTENDPKQYTNLANVPEYAPVVNEFKAKLAAKLREVRDNDLRSYRPVNKTKGRPSYHQTTGRRIR